MFEACLSAIIANCYFVRMCIDNGAITRNFKSTTGESKSAHMLKMVLTLSSEIYNIDDTTLKNLKKEVKLAMEDTLEYCPSEASDRLLHIPIKGKSPWFGFISHLMSRDVCTVKVRISDDIPDEVASCFVESEGVMQFIKNNRMLFETGALSAVYQEYENRFYDDIIPIICFTQTAEPHPVNAFMRDALIAFLLVEFGSVTITDYGIDITLDEDSIFGLCGVPKMAEPEDRDLMVVGGPIDMVRYMGTSPMVSIPGSYLYDNGKFSALYCTFKESMVWETHLSMMVSFDTRIKRRGRTARIVIIGNIDPAIVEGIKRRVPNTQILYADGIISLDSMRRFGNALDRSPEAIRSYIDSIHAQLMMASDSVSEVDRCITSYLKSKVLMNVKSTESGGLIREDL